MGAATSVHEQPGVRLGVMVRTARELWVYWSLPGNGAPALRVLDVTGRPPAASLDGTGERAVAVAPGASSQYVGDLLPGHLYTVQLMQEGRMVIAAGPVQTPWLAAGDESSFPAPYTRS